MTHVSGELDRPETALAGPGCYAENVRKERLVTIGRLTSAIVHEINNPMQAIRGALTLAMEELEDRQAVASYLELCQQEADRSIQLIGMIRQIYRPHASDPGPVDVAALLHQAADITRDGVNQQGVKLHLDLDEPLPRVVAAADQLQLALISLILNLADAMGDTGGGELGLRAGPAAAGLWIELAAGAPLNLGLSAPPDPGGRAWIDLSTPFEILRLHRAIVDVLRQGETTTIRIDIPAA
jgi:signal transduction histidine kinase